MVDIRRGIYSDIPMCCILWYVTIWPIFLYFKLNEWYVPTFLNNFNFIACPKCIMLYGNTEKMINPKPIPNEKRFMYNEYQVG